METGGAGHPRLRNAVVETFDFDKGAFHRLCLVILVGSGVWVDKHLTTVARQAFPLVMLGQPRHQRYGRKHNLDGSDTVKSRDSRLLR